MKKADALARLQRAIDAIPDLVNSRQQPEFEQWRRDTGVAIRYIFGENSRHAGEFAQISWTPGLRGSRTTNQGHFMAAYQRGLDRAGAILQSMYNEVHEYWPEDETQLDPPDASEAHVTQPEEYTTQQQLYRVLQVIGRYTEKNPYSKTEDQYISRELDVPLADVQAYLDLLKGTGMVTLRRGINGRRSAELTSQGYLALKDRSLFISVPSLPSIMHYVDLGRLEDLRAIKSEQFDLLKLIRLCEELNTCYAGECYLATAMLVRAILDHVPPIFGVKHFAEVASNYPGSRSFKASMQHLEGSSRKIADAHLHTQIRSKEVLPNKTQVNVSNDLDVLLAEIIRLLK